MKLANFDYLLGLLSTKQPTLLFVDVCGGPGGFTEYILTRSKALGIAPFGWGISITSSSSEAEGLGKADSCEWRFPSLPFPVISESAAEQPQSGYFMQCAGADGTGNILNNANIKSFCEQVGVMQMYSQIEVNNPSIRWPDVLKQFQHLIPRWNNQVSDKGLRRLQARRRTQLGVIWAPLDHSQGKSTLP